MNPIQDSNQNEKTVLKTVALVGRPNVGKSRLFNRLTKKRISIVHDQPGVTRDVIVADVEGHYTLMDTGGIGLDTNQNNAKVIDEAVRDQVDLAIQAADLILFVTDGQAGCTLLDQFISEKLRQYGKIPLLVVNKIDHFKHEGAVGDFYALGFGEPIAVSAEHGQGMEELDEAILKRIGPAPKILQNDFKDKRIRICFAGRPNVGKSSLGNALLKNERLIVSDVPGTTRDAVELNLDYTPPNGQTSAFTLIDTAGLRQRTKIRSTVEQFSVMRTEKAIENTHIVFLVLDAKEGVTQLDQKLVGKICDLGKGLIVLVNKWDLATDIFHKSDGIHGYKDIHEFQESFVNAVRKAFFSIPEVPVLFTSAKEGYKVNAILTQASMLYQKMQATLPTSKLNRTISQLMTHKAMSFKDGRHFKVYYVVQTGVSPLRFRLYCNHSVKMDEPYKRYIENGLTREFGLQGCPMYFELIGKPKRRS